MKKKTFVLINFLMILSCCQFFSKNLLACDGSIPVTGMFCSNDSDDGLKKKLEKKQSELDCVFRASKVLSEYKEIESKFMIRSQKTAYFYETQWYLQESSTINFSIKDNLNRILEEQERIKSEMQNYLKLLESNLQSQPSKESDFRNESRSLRHKAIDFENQLESMLRLLEYGRISTENLQYTRQTLLPDYSCLGDSHSLATVVENALISAEQFAQTIVLQKNSLKSIVGHELALVQNLIQYVTQKTTLQNLHQAGVELSQSEAKIASLVELFRLQEEILDEKVQSGGKDWPTNHYLRYLQLESNQDHAGLKLARIKAIRSQVEALDVDETAMAMVLSDIDGLSRNLSKGLARMQERGWRGTLERQQLIVNKMADIKKQYPKKCQQLLSSWQKLGQTIQDVEEYRISEKKYLHLIHTCRGGRS